MNIPLPRYPNTTTTVDCIRIVLHTVLESFGTRISQIVINDTQNASNQPTKCNPTLPSKLTVYNL